jgi:uncharacterized membrane protein YfcA
VDLNLSIFLIVCPLVFLAGFVDSIAGGGGLVSLPAYLLAGLPIHFALGTNKLSSVMGAVTASIRYYKNGYVDLLLCIPSIIAALAGSAIGTLLTLHIDERYLQWILVVVLPVTAFYVLRQKELRSGEAFSRWKTAIIAALVSFVIGGYDGFFGPGTGTFLILLYCGLAHMEGRTATGNAKFVNLASNLSAAVLFLLHGKVLIPLGLTAGIFSIAGSWLGSGLAIKKGTGIIRIFILVVLVFLFIRIILNALNIWEF